MQYLCSSSRFFYKRYFLHCIYYFVDIVVVDIGSLVCLMKLRFIYKRYILYCLCYFIGIDS